MLWPRVPELVTYITDVLGHFFDMNSVPGLWQRRVRTLRQVLLHIRLVLVLGEHRELVTMPACGISPGQKASIWAAGGYLGHQAADCLCQEDLWRVRYGMAASSFLDVFLFVFQLQG